ncbi:MAG: efflux RND transporter periplasmic adaptor subunit [Pirellulales bacterium]|nr:efflux RND transporter periplasmic adaptor subunit [Pirellulales bacterium]
MRVLLILALLPGVTLAHEGHAPLPTKGAIVKGDRLMLSASASQAIGVQFGKVELAEVRESIRAVASVELPWSQQAYVTTLIAGRIESVLVKPGESVSAGQELARVSGIELETLQLALLQANKEKALTDQLLAGQTTAGEVISGKLMLQTRTDARQQAIRFKVAWEKLKAIGLTDDALWQVCRSGTTVAAVSILAPIDGVVSRADVRAGQIVQPTDHLYHIVDPSRVWVVAKVLEADVGSVKIGQPVEVTFAALPGRLFQSTVDHLELRINADRTLSVKSVLQNSGDLRPGLFGRVRIVVDSTKAVVCPRESLADGFAFVQQSTGNLIRKPVNVAVMRGGQAEIADGLFPGDKVVTVGSHELSALFARPTTKAAADVQPMIRATQGQIEVPTDQKAFASAPIEGRIRRIFVEHGQRVHKGQILAELDSLSFRNLQLDLLQARTNLDEATQNLARLESLRDSVVRKEFWKAQSERDQLRYSVTSLENQLALLGADDQGPFVPIRAPAAGLICDFTLIPGQVVARNDSLFELHNLTTVWARAYLFAHDAAQVAVGQAVQVGLASDPRFSAPATIERLHPLLVSGNRALAVWLELDNPDLRLKEGMAAIIKLGI